MNSIQQKAPVIADWGWYSIRATDKARTAPAALRNTLNRNLKVSRYEIRL